MTRGQHKPNSIVAIRLMKVNVGDTVVVLEAMKMENDLAAPVSGTIKAINFKSGDSAAKNDVLCVIG